MTPCSTWGPKKSLARRLRGIGNVTVQRRKLRRPLMVRSVGAVIDNARARGGLNRRFAIEGVGPHGLVHRVAARLDRATHAAHCKPLREEPVDERAAHLARAKDNVQFDVFHGVSLEVISGPVPESRGGAAWALQAQCCCQAGEHEEN